mgnify:CR=1 FL=1
MNECVLSKSFLPELMIRTKINIFLYESVWAEYNTKVNLFKLSEQIYSVRSDEEKSSV